ncbi:hypothetical protein F4805DRAFT_468791 [Annulohypoxylon moriforme]|nr:hypothetical protein F4805DRAFT_468791 [Annulohypoxylon moriforme]
MSRLLRIGFTQLSSRNPLSGSHEANIILVHGLRGHPQTTWEATQSRKDESATAPKTRNFFKRLSRHIHSAPAHNGADDNHDESNNAGPSGKHKVFWPRDYLIEDLPEANVWTYGYNADVIGGLFQANNQNSVSQHGKDLQVKIERELKGEGFQGPIIFVAHSLGGIVVKDAIRRSEFCRAQTKLIIFLGTPHQGSSYAGWGAIASNLAGLALQDTNKRIVKTLEVNSEVLDNIQEEFLRVVPDADIRIHSFQEARGISGVKGLHGKVVDNSSSKVGLPQFEIVESIDADHMQMARCDNKTDPPYSVLSKVIRQFIRDNLARGGANSAERLMMNREPLGKGKGHQNSVVTKPCYSIPLPRNHRFTGRSDILSQLQEKFIIQKECRKVAIVGLGGVGKTQVALKWAYWMKDNLPDYSVLWVPAQNDVSFEQAYTEIAKQLSIRSEKGEDLKELVQRYLDSEAAGKWLLIVDNADDYDDFFGPPTSPGGLNKYLPKNDNGLILFTTRSRDVAIAATGSDVIDLHKMSPEEATNFLEKTLIRKQLLQNKIIVKELLEELTYLPLAIMQAAAYIDRNQISIEKYLGFLRGTEQTMVGLLSREFHDETRYPGSQNAIATTWLVSMEQIQKSDSTAAELLSFLSCIEPKAIPQSLLPMPQSEETEHAIGTLRGYSFLVKRGNDDIFDMHSLVHVATRLWIRENHRTQEVVVQALDYIEGIFPSEDPENRELWQIFLPHALSVLEGSKEYQIEKRYDLLFSVGGCLYKDRRFKEAVKALEEAYVWKKKHTAPDAPSQLILEHWLASACLDNRQIKEAIEILEHVVAIKKDILAEEDNSRLASEHELARAYLDNRQIIKGIEILEHVVTIRRKILTEDDDDRLLSEHMLASAYLENNQIKEAIEISEHVVAIRRKKLTEEDHERLTSEHELARAYLENNQIKEAIKIFERVISTEDDHVRLMSEHDLAAAYLENKQIKESIEILEHVVATKANVLDEDDYSRINSQALLAEAYDMFHEDPVPETHTATKNTSSRPYC